MSFRSTAFNPHSEEEPHIIYTLLVERAVKLSQREMLWPLVLRACSGFLGYKKAVHMADTIAPLNGREAFDYLSQSLQLNMHVSGSENVPQTGAVIATPNHPAGVADGVAIYDTFKELRDDIVFVANRDALRISPGMEDIIIPVEWRDEFRTVRRNRETVRALVQAIKQERFIVIFPSGRLARPTVKGLRERPWQITALNLAQKYDIDVLPVNIKGHNTALYYASWYINTELKDLTLFRELLNKTGQSYEITIGKPFKSEGDVQEDTENLRSFVLNDLHRGVAKYR